MNVTRKLFLILLLANTLLHALPFSIVPKNPLPTSLSTGSTVSVFYTVTNNTQALRLLNYVKYLPPRVVQVTAGIYPDTCGATFNLAGKGLPGDSCTLQLLITGPVNAFDPNPHHHLFVCFPAGKTCAGTNYPLNVFPRPAKQLLSIAISPINASILGRQTQQYTAIGTYDDNTTQDITTSVTWLSSAPTVATISPAGLATGVGTGTTQINAKFGQITSNTATLTVTVFAYITNFGNNTISYCAVNADSTFGICNPFSDPSFNQPDGIKVNAAVTFVYVANSNNNAISVCPIHPDGSLAACSESLDSTFNSPSSVTFNQQCTVAYVANFNGNTVSICPINPNATLATCTISSQVFNFPNTIRLNSTGTIAYVVNHLNDNVSICPVNANSTLGNCTLSPTTALNHPVGIVINSTNTFAYLSNSQNVGGNRNATSCPLNSDGSFGTCVEFISTLFNGGNFGKIALNDLNTFVYIVNENNNYVSLCSLDSNGYINACSRLFPSAGGFNLPQGIDVL